MRRAGAGLLLLAALVAGCGYSFTGSLPAHIRTVAVPTFRNLTGEPAVETTLTSAVVNAFVTSGKLRVVPVDEADSILDGEVTGYQVHAVAVDRRLDVREYRLVVTMNIALRDVRQGTVLFREDGLREQADFRVSSQVADTISREEGAVRAAAIDVGRKIVNLVVDRF